MITRLLIDSEDWSCRYRIKEYFYGLLEQHKQLKIKEMNEVWPDIYNER